MVVYISSLELTFRNSASSLLCQFSTDLIPLPWWGSSRFISDTIASLRAKYKDLYKITRNFMVCAVNAGCNIIFF